MADRAGGIEGAVALAVLGLVGLVGIALIYGAARWHAESTAIRERLQAGRLPPTTGPYRADALSALPAPVRRYFQAVLRDGQPRIAAARLEHTGTFNTGERWKPFTSTQDVIPQQPGFDWEARIAMMPGFAVRVHDAYVAGEGILHASVFGLVSLVDLRGTAELAEGELMRFLAEAAWYPTVLLPGQGVEWEAVDDASAKATMTDGRTRVSLLFGFDEAGLIASVRAEARGRIVGSAVVPTPWEGRWSRYELRDGMRVPLEGEVAWLLPEGRQPYWRGHITRIEYEPVP